MQTTSTILMIRPVSFSYNEQTAGSNAFQLPGLNQQKVQEKALAEFDQFVALLRSNGVEVIVVNDIEQSHTPDSIFPNNWVSTHNNGQIIIYPLKAKNRRLEKRADIISLLKQRFKYSETIDLSYFEQEQKFLESTGSLVLDRENKIAYACFSSRTSPEVLTAFNELTGYNLITFNALDESGKAIYHTNVLMCLGIQFVVICLQSIIDFDEREKLVRSFKETGKEIIEITFKQMSEFAGNMLQLNNKTGNQLTVMSERAYQSLSIEQINQLENFGKLVHSPLNTIENNGGGSARCMIAEIHLPPLTS